MNLNPVAMRIKTLKRGAVLHLLRLHLLLCLIVTIINTNRRRRTCRPVAAAGVRNRAEIGRHSPALNCRRWKKSLSGLTTLTPLSVKIWPNGSAWAKPEFKYVISLDVERRQGHDKVPVLNNYSFCISCIPIFLNLKKQKKKKKMRFMRQKIRRRKEITFDKWIGNIFFGQSEVTTVGYA